VSSSHASAASAGKYAQVNGLKMYYEVHGAGRPLVLLHGGVSNIQKDFGPLIPRLAKTHKVIAPEQAARHPRRSPRLAVLDDDAVHRCADPGALK